MNTTEQRDAGMGEGIAKATTMEVAVIDGAGRKVAIDLLYPDQLKDLIDECATFAEVLDEQRRCREEENQNCNRTRRNRL